MLYPNLTQLDMTGPAQVLHRMPGARLFYAWKRIEPVMSDCRLALMPTVTLDDCPQLDILCVPGGYGCTDMMMDDAILQWLRRQAAGATLITSVCTGSLVLAAAGLLEGYRAGCYWASGHQLAQYGATYVPDRTVVDRDRITAGGVTSGIDFAFRIIERLHGRDAAEMVQLGIEYDPEPLSGGTPATARPEILAAVQARMAPLAKQRDALFRAAAERYRARTAD